MANWADFLALAEDPELRLAGEHLSSTDDAALPAAESDAVVTQYGCSAPALRHVPFAEGMS